MISRRKLTIGMAFVTVVGETASQAETAFSSPLREMVAKAAKLLETSGLKSGVSNEMLEKSEDEFNALLVDIGRAIGPTQVRQLRETEGNTIDDKLALLSWHRRTFGGAYDEIANTYLFPKAPQLRVAPELRDIHVREDYRLVWERYLLKPPPGLITLGDVRVMQALERIQNPSSVLSLVESFRITALPDVSLKGKYYIRQSRLISTLGGFPSERGLMGLLKCLEYSRKQHASDGSEDVRVSKAIANALTYIDPHSTNIRADSWRSVIAAIPQRRLLPSESRFLRSIMAPAHSSK
jgi:hypothetical protein